MVQFVVGILRNFRPVADIPVPAIWHLAAIEMLNQIVAFSACVRISHSGSAIYGSWAVGPLPGTGFQLYMKIGVTGGRYFILWAALFDIFKV